MKRKLSGGLVAMATLGLLASCSGDVTDGLSVGQSGSGTVPTPGGASGGPSGAGAPNAAGGSSPATSGRSSLGGVGVGAGGATGGVGAASWNPTSGGSGGGPGTGGSAGASARGGTPGSTSGGVSGGIGGIAGFAGSAAAAGRPGMGGAGAGVGGSAGSLGCGKPAAKSGAFQAQMTSFNLERSYFVSVPANYDPAKPYVLIFGYHGSNYTGQRMRTYLDLEKAPLAGNTIFVYPDGLPLTGQPDHIAWELNEGSRDLIFFDDLLAKVSDEYCIDRERIFVNGQSFGGLMTNAVGCLRGDVVRAIAVVAGSGPRSSTCKGQVAAWLTHGTDDTSVQYSGGEKSRDHWVQANHCTTMSVPTPPTPCMSYEGCDAGHPVVWCPHTNDGGHQHPSFGKAAVRSFFSQF